MRRTRTTTMLLLGAAGVAMTAVSGCVSVTAAGPPGQGSRPGAAAASPGAQNVRPQVVQAPAREALEMADPPSPSPAAPRPAADAGPAQVPRRLSGPHPGPDAALGPVPQRDAAGRHEAGRVPDRAQNPRHDRAVGQSGARNTLPAPGSVPANAAALCALGTTYGRWPAGSPQARICQETYGR